MSVRASSLKQMRVLMPVGDGCATRTRPAG